MTSTLRGLGSVLLTACSIKYWQPTVTLGLRMRALPTISTSSTSPRYWTSVFEAAALPELACCRTYVHELGLVPVCLTPTLPEESLFSSYPALASDLC